MTELKIVDRGLFHADDTSLTVQFGVLSDLQEQLQAGDCLIATVSGSSGWSTPAGWGSNGSVVWRVLTGDEGTVTFNQLEHGRIEARFTLVRSVSDGIDCG